MAAWQGTRAMCSGAEPGTGGFSMQRRSTVCLLPLPIGLACFALAGLLAPVPGRAAGVETKGTVKGLVLGEDGQPAPGARVRAVLIPETEPFDPFKPAVDLTTDATGCFEAQLPAGKYLPLATKGPLTSLEHDSRVWWWEVKAGETLGDVRIELDQGSRIEGRVVRKSDGSPIAGARVVLETGLAATSDAEGKFLLEPAPAWGGETLVMAPGLATEFAAAGIVWAGETTRVRVQMAPGFRVQGRVTDEQGRPVPGARVEETGSRAPVQRMLRRCVTDAQGRYDLPGCPFGLRFGIAVSHPDFAAASKERLAPPKAGDVLTVDLVLTKGLVLEGDVLGPDGKPVPAALVKCGDQEARTEANGAFRLDKLGPGQSGTLMVLASGCAPMLQSLSLGPDQPVRRLSLRLAAGKVATGRVVDPKGRPVAGAKLIPTVPIPNT